MTHQYFKSFFLFLVSAMLLAVSTQSRAIAADLVEPQKAIQNASNQLKAYFQEDNFDQDFANINLFVEGVIDPHMDFDKISSLVVGKHWRGATADEKKNFKKEFKTLLIRTYSRAFIDFKEWTIRFMPLDMEKSVRKVKKTKAVTVQTKILQPGKRPFSIDYRMWLVNGEWKVYDIMIEGISLVKNYRKSIGTRVAKPGASLASVTEYLAKKNSNALSGKQEPEKQS